jgi:hypothetical protein
MDDKKKARPILIRFSSTQELIDYTIRMELKYFVAKLLYSHYNRDV